MLYEYVKSYLLLSLFCAACTIFSGRLILGHAEAKNNTHCKQLTYKSTS